jgi:hypothetical protein
LVLAGPNTWWPIAWLAKRQTSTSRSTTEAELVALAKSLFDEALPFLSLFELILGRPVELLILEDNQATIKIARKGYSSKLRHVPRTHKVNLGSIAEVLEEDTVEIEYVPTELQCADIFTKDLCPAKWQNALDLLGMQTQLPDIPKVSKAPPVAESAPAPPLVSAPVVGAAIAPQKLCQRCPDMNKNISRGNRANCDIAQSVVDGIADIFSKEENDVLHRHTVQTISAAASYPKPQRVRASGTLRGWGDVVEVCTSPDSTLGQAGTEFDNVRVIRITRDTDFGNRTTVRDLVEHIKSMPGTSVHGSLPCTVWSTWQAMALHKGGQAYAAELAIRRAESLKMLRSFIKVAELALSLGGEVSFEWPKNCTGWLRRELITFIARNKLYSVLVDGCACGMKDADGLPFLKQWRFITSSERQATSLADLKCQHDSAFKHAQICGSATKGTESYPMPLCRTMLASLFGSHKHAPAMPCIPVQAQHEHRECIEHPADFAASPMTEPIGFVMEQEECAFAPPVHAMVTKLLDRAETNRNPRAIAAVKAEADALVDAGTWLESTVIEKDELLKQVGKSGERIHLGELMKICSVKFFEMASEFWKYKGRICFRGDNVKDQDGAVAVFQEMSSSPTAVQGVNANVAYGCLPGHDSEVADAIRAYIQSLLKSKQATWVAIPRDLWPDSWKGKYTKPMCLLVKALYGHPESGGHWENHLTSAVRACGGAPVPTHPSSFWFPEEKMLLSVYVDDLLLSGPKGGHAKIWEKLRKGSEPIALDDPEPLDRFLGRGHARV